MGAVMYTICTPKSLKLGEIVRTNSFQAGANLVEDTVVYRVMALATFEDWVSFCTADGLPPTQQMVEQVKGWNFYKIHVD